MSGGETLRQMIIARLDDQVPAFEGRVYDQALDSTPYPYATLGASYGTPDSSQGIRVRARTVQIDIWTDSDKGTCEALTDAVSDALDGWYDTSRLKMPPLHVSLTRVMDDPRGSFHGIVQVEGRVEG